jgi:thioredoxin 1
MICPQCENDAPANNYRCPHCGSVLKPDIEPSDFRKPRAKKPSINANVIILAIIVIGLAVIVYAAFFKEKGGRISTGQTGPGEPSPQVNQPARPASNADTAAPAPAGSSGYPPGFVINSKNPGDEIDIEDFVQRGNTTIFDFYSEFCGPCRRISPLLKRLDMERDDIVVLKVDINREGTRGIDWRSPVARQYQLRSVPHFVIYDASGTRTHEGQVAYGKVLDMLRDAELIR